MTAAERRVNQRFQIRLPMTVRWTSGGVGETNTESKTSARAASIFSCPRT